MWSPTRTEIAIEASCSNPGWEAVVAIFRPTGTWVKTISPGDRWTSGLTYDPTGDQLASADGQSLFRINRATGRLTFVLPNMWNRPYVWGPVWSPDGRRIAYSEDSNNGFHLRNIKVDGTNARTIFAGAYGSAAFAQDW